MKIVRIRSYSGLCFPAFGVNTDQNNSEYGHFLRRDYLKFSTQTKVSMNPLLIITSYMGGSKRRALINVFKAQLSYSPLISMCCNRYLNHKINWLYETCLRFIVTKWLFLHGTVSFHYQNIQELGTEMLADESSKIMKEIFEIFNETKKILFSAAQKV